HVVGGFFATENAKSELLLQLGRLHLDDVEVAAARQELLDVEVTRARAVHMQLDTANLQRQAAAAKRRFLDARRVYPRFAGLEEHADYGAQLESFVSGLASEGRVLVHYNIHDGRIVGYWVAEDGSVRGWTQGDCVDLQTAQAAINPWLLGTHGDVRALLSAVVGFAEELDAALADVEATELVIVPWSLLYAVPFGALQLGGGILSDKYRVSYAPSIEILRRLAFETRLDRSGVELIAAHGGSLPWADAEVAAAEAVYGKDANLVPDGSDREKVVEALRAGRLIHVAAHGASWGNDHAASAIRLHENGGGDEYLTAAEVHRDIDLRGAELILLAACESGRGATGNTGIELYNGLDGAFLAQGARAVVSTMWPVWDFASFLFMTNLHTQLQTGSPVGAAFDSSVTLLRSGEYRCIEPNNALGRALDAGSSAWRREIDRIGDRYTDPYVWAPFRLSGAHWLSHPLNSEAAA
ncbi:MAG: CHAT domain-containing protein, partial [Actinomycetota bacterium]|nr:CHAT domain-containing protein [Actinomycetota bacterium]